MTETCADILVEERGNNVIYMQTRYFNIEDLNLDLVVV